MVSDGFSSFEVDFDQNNVGCLKTFAPCSTPVGYAMPPKSKANHQSTCVGKKMDDSVAPLLWPDSSTLPMQIGMDHDGSFRLSKHEVCHYVMVYQHVFYSTYGGFLKWGHPQSSSIYRCFFPYKTIQPRWHAAMALLKVTTWPLTSVDVAQMVNVYSLPWKSAIEFVYLPFTRTKWWFSMGFCMLTRG